MKRILSFLLVLAMLCSFVPAFAQEEAPADEPAAEEVVVETAAEETAEEPAEEAAPAEEPAAEESSVTEDPGESVPAETEESPAVDITAVDAAPEEESASEEPASEEELPTTDGEEAPAEVTLYGLESYYEEYLSIPDDYLQSYVINGSNISVSGSCVELDGENTIKPSYDTWYWYGSIGYSVPRSDEEPTSITKDLNTGTATVYYTDDLGRHSITVQVLDYADVYANQVMDDYIADNITDGMSDLEIVNAIAAFPAGYDYSVSASSAKGMIIKGGGDCWASTDAIITLCTKLGITSWSRNGNRDTGAGSGHRNAMVLLNGTYYEVEAGYYATAPRYYSVKIRTSLFSYRYVTGGIEVYQYDGQTTPAVLEIPEEINGETVVSIGNSAFSRCTGLTGITIPDSVTGIGPYAFSGCSSLKDLTIPDGVTSIGDYTFWGCRSLTDLTIPENVTSIGSCAFCGCSGLTGLTIPENVTSIGDYAFYGCTGLTGMTIPENVTSIDDYTFCGCSSLASVTIPAGLTAVGSCAFDECSALTEVFYGAGETERSGIDIDSSGNSALTDAVWHYLAAVYPLASGRSVTADISGAGFTAYYAFTPTASKTYVIYSTGSADTKVTLYDASGAVLASDDNSGSGNNFRLAYTLAAGTTYRYAVSYADASAKGSIAFKFGRVYTVTYDANGGTGAPAAQTKDYAAALTLSGTVPARSGYTFLGWSAASTAAAATYAAGGSYTANGNVTLYAVWKQNAATLSSGRTCTAQITAAGAKVYYEFTPTSSNTYVIYSTGSADTRVALYDASGTLLATNDNSGEGNNFRLAYAMTAGTTYRYAVYYRSSAATGSISFTFGRVYTIRYSANGGSGAPASQTRDYGSVLTMSSTVPTRSGYTFLGWAANSTATAATYAAGGSYTVNGNVTLYAVWQATVPLISGRSYTAAISKGGAKVYCEFTPTASNTYVIYSTGSADTRVALYDASGTLLATNDNSGEGNNFRLAYAMTAGTTYRYAVYYRSSAATGSISFTLGRVYTIRYSANGGSGAPAAQKHDYGTALTLSSTVPTRTGYTFLGWAAGSTATAATYKAGGTYTANGNVTLYAVWQKNS